ncbi:hypothetical protein PR048_005952 [Dryococelus australis]|uniref:Uncharacterized protein n=1 Tax=Dryococelus australis TaxID=614101 RepID=A0ABQ9IAK7_9NEOP|nr:hypothetical protein PR048_005952 [Dryococelus australis]
MGLIELNMELRRNEEAGETGDTVENPKAVFIFISNTGGHLIIRKHLELWKSGKNRKDFRLRDFEDLIKKGAFNVKETALISDKFGVSDEATVANISNVLQDLGLIIKNWNHNVPLITGGGDIGLIHEPGGQYVGHVTPVNSTGSKIAKCILKYLENSNFDINQLQVSGCDGTFTNTGWKNCLASFSGEIRKPLAGCEKLCVVNIKPIDSEENNRTKTDLSKDHHNLLDFIQAVQTGMCAPHHAVKAQDFSVISVFVSQTNPNELMILTSYIVKTDPDPPVLFDIKRHLPDCPLKIIHPVIQRNDLFWHPRNLFLAMAVDELPHIMK